MNRIANKSLKKRILEISKAHNLSHLSSCLTAVDIIKEIYDLKKEDEPFVLSSGHAGLALYVVLEATGQKTAEAIYAHHGVHPDRCGDCHLDCSSGSLGHGLGIAVGMALSNPNRNVYCLVSDGEMAEGSIFEALRIAQEAALQNLKIYVNVNGWGAYGRINPAKITSLLRPYEQGLDITVVLTEGTYEDFSFLRGVDGHYTTLDDDSYKTGMELVVE